MNEELDQKAPIASALRILIVDNNHDSAISLSMLISKLGYLAFTVYSLEAAVQAAADFHPNVVLLDIDIPGLDSMNICTDIREAAGTKSVTLVALTTGKDQSARAEERRACCDHHLTKTKVASPLMEILDEAQKRLETRNK